ncbi:hypothetical protein PVAP13_6NG032383 [Panicum virgatum]|uniref:Uncharacterized protein n=1 Tax=Panicum virgatum TaxID=38727 RepID=A0A8T0QTY4_PANVG|nr:hypothetical protein PVAP13_6NG032383 [Panicum virgatum]
MLNPRLTVSYKTYGRHPPSLAPAAPTLLFSYFYLSSSAVPAQIQSRLLPPPLFPLAPSDPFPAAASARSFAHSAAAAGELHAQCGVAAAGISMRGGGGALTAWHGRGWGPPLAVAADPLAARRQWGSARGAAAGCSARDAAARSPAAGELCSRRRRWRGGGAAVAGRREGTVGRSAANPSAAGPPPQKIPGHARAPRPSVTRDGGCVGVTTNPPPRTTASLWSGRPPSPTPLPLPPHQRLLSDGARNGAEIPALSEAGDPRIRATVRPAVEDQEAVL